MVLPKNRWLRGAYLMTQRYLRHNVGSQSAALAFYLLFIVCQHVLFGSVHLVISETVAFHFLDFF